MRQTGIDIIGDVPWGTHFCQFYRDQQDLIDILIPYFKAGLENNEFCMWVTSEPLSAEEARRALVREVEHAGEYLAEGRIEILDYAQWYTPGGAFDSDRVLAGWVRKLDEARKRGFEGLRLTGNTFWLEKTDWQSFTEYEAKVDGIIGRYPMLAICTYSLARCGAPEIMDVVANHSFALIKRSGEWHIIESAERKRMEASLRASQARYESVAGRERFLADVVEKAEQPFTSGYPDGRLGICNRAFCDLTGYSAEELRDVDWATGLTGPEWKEAEKAALDELARTGKPVRYQKEYIRKDGRRVPVELLVDATRTETGDLAPYHAFVTDISDRRRIEREHEQLVRMHLEARTAAEGQAEQLRQAHRRQQLLADVVGRLLATEEPQAIVGDLAHRVMRELDCDLFFNFLADARQGRLRLNAYAGIPEEAARAIQWLDYGTAVCGCVARDGCRIVSEDIPAHPDPRTDLVRSYGAKAYACHPLLAGGRVIGTLSFGSRARIRFSADDLSLMQGVADHIAIAMERIRAQKAVRDSERLYRAIGESIDYGVWVCEPDGRNTYASESFLKMVGITQAQCSSFGWGGKLHPDEADRTIAAWKECVSTGGTWDVEHNYRGADGQFHPVLARGVPVRDEHGEVLCWAGINLDIGRLKSAELKMRHQNAVLEGINRIYSDTLACETEEETGRECLRVAEELTRSRFGFIGEINAQGRLDDIAISDPGWEACRMDVPAGKASPPTGFAVHGIYGRVLLDGRGFYTNDPSSHPDAIGTPAGHPALKAFLGVPLKHGDKTIGMIALGNREGGYSAQDLALLEALAPTVVQVLLRKRAERAVRAGEERLRQAQKMESIGLLAGGIAHDFNNLLVGIIGNASLAEDMLPYGSPGAEILKSIIASGEQAAHLTRQMLAYAGKGRFLLEPVNLSSIVADGGALAQVSISKKITVDLHLSAKMPAVETDPSQMQQIFMNLFLNAGEAIGSGPGVITVSTGEISIDDALIRKELADWPIEPGQFAFLEVRDTGCGMDDATQSKIFDPFFTTKFHGRGLGLAAVAGIVRAHKGAIQLTTAPGAGSAFRVLLPAMAAGLAEAAPPAESRGNIDGKGTVLVVDDEHGVRDVARRALERHGYEVLLAESGPAAIELVRTHAGGGIDLVVLDLGMPGMGGEEVLPQLRRLKPDLDIIVSSGYSETEALEAFHGVRVSGFIQKPYTARELAAEVKAALA